MVCALWWAWVSTTWVTNWLDPVKLPVRGAVVALAFVALVMSVAIAEAFGERAWTFAIAYVVLQVGRTGFIVWATARHDRAVSRDFTVRAGVDGGRRRAVDRRARCCRCHVAAAALGRGARLELIGTVFGYPGARVGPRAARRVGRLRSAHRRAHRAVRAHRARRGPPRHRLRFRRRWSPRSRVDRRDGRARSSRRRPRGGSTSTTASASAPRRSRRPTNPASRAHRLHLGPPRDHRAASC